MGFTICLVKKFRLIFDCTMGYEGKGSKNLLKVGEVGLFYYSPGSADGLEPSAGL